MPTLFVDNDNDIWIRGLQLWLDKSYVTDATLDFNLYSDSARTVTVSGATSIAMTFVSATNGDYRGVVPGTVTLTAGTTYYGRIVDTATYADKIEWEPEFIARDRKT